MRNSGKKTKPPVWDSRMRRAGGSLFERLVSDQEDLVPSIEGDPVEDQVRSVKRNLVKILNTREGGSASSPGLGVCDFNDAMTETQDMAKFIAQSIRRCIDLYEPRVRVSSVVHVPNPDRPLNLQFKINTTMKVENKDQIIQIDLVMEDGKTAKVM